MNTQRICLIAEDSAPVIYLLRTFAEMSGFQTLIASVGERALEIAQHRQVAVVLLNLMLPGKVRGWDVLRHLKSDPATCHIPVVVFQADEAAPCAPAEGADALLQLPVLYEGFVGTLARSGVAVGGPAPDAGGSPAGNPIGGD
jgi:CheY-like chemotaxis protein